MLALLAGMPGFCQSRKRPPAPKPQPLQTAFPIQSLRVVGAKVYPLEGILKVAGLKIGEPATEARFNEARDRLAATGMFETIGFKFEPSADRKGYDATFEVVEITPLLPFQFEELPVEPAKIVAHLKAVDPLYGGRIPATKPMLERYSGLIESFLAAQGKPEKVVGRVQADQPEKLYVLFRPAKLPRISRPGWRQRSPRKPRPSPPPAIEVACRQR